MALKTKWLLSADCPASCTMTGVWRAVAYDEGCVVIFHGPAGCVHVASTMDLGNHYRRRLSGKRGPGTFDFLKPSGKGQHFRRHRKAS